MVTTSPDALYSPDNVDDYDLIVDLAAMQTSTQAALNNRPRGYSAATVTALPTTGLTGNPSGWTTSDQRAWRWTGTKWVLVGGRYPSAQVGLAANTNVSTSYVGLNTGNSGIAAAGNFTVPAGCGGIYDYSFNALVAEAGAWYIRPFVNSTAAGNEAAASNQRGFSGQGIISLNAGDVLQFRARVFQGTYTIDASQTYFSLVYRCAN